MAAGAWNPLSVTALVSGLTVGFASKWEVLSTQVGEPMRPPDLITLTAGDG